jgi:NADPH:quinone reductase
VYDTYTFGDHSLGVSLLSNTKRGTFIHNTHGQAAEAVLASKKGRVDCRHIQGFSHAIPEFGQMFWKQLPIWLETGKITPLKYKVIDGLDSAKVNAALDEYKEGRGGERYHVRLA